ncbi:MAG TPA: NAD+ synthase [Candidatus Aminicenantes bacterium]|nr:NAD+ synthase [Candidatus Aminicenantes bacterium]
MIELDYTQVEAVLVRFIRDFVHKNGFENAVLGVSGGLDSAVALSLTRLALGPRHTRALFMPYRLSSPQSPADAQALCRELEVKAETVEITSMVDAYLESFPTDNPVQVGNLCARARMMVLFDHSERYRALVIGTSNKSEILIGYSTIFGDSAAACLPLGDLYKTQVFGLAAHLDIPAQIRNKPPTADLWDQQTDEGEIGLTYKELDRILFHRVEERLRVDEVVALGHERETVLRVEDMIVRSQFKRVMPPVAKLQNRSVGIDFRYPRDWKR